MAAERSNLSADLTMRVMGLAGALEEFLPFCTETNTREHDFWIQCVYQFPNGYGASVISGLNSYGGAEGTYELAVLNHSGVILYTTPITHNVLGHLSLPEVRISLQSISLLPLDKVLGSTYLVPVVHEMNLRMHRTTA